MTRETKRGYTKPITLGDHLMLVYVVAPSPEGPCKIGITNNLQRRLSALQTGCWEPLSVYSFRLGILSHGGADHLSMTKAISAGARELERAAHQALKACDLHLCGEWFDVTVDEARSVLDKCSELDGIKSVTLEQLFMADIPPGTEPAVEAARKRMIKNIGAPAMFVAQYQPHPLDTDTRGV